MSGLNDEAIKLMFTGLSKLLFASCALGISFCITFILYAKSSAWSHLFTGDNFNKHFKQKKSPSPPGCFYSLLE